MWLCFDICVVCDGGVNFFVIWVIVLLFYKPGFMERILDDHFLDWSSMRRCGDPQGDF